MVELHPVQRQLLRRCGVQAHYRDIWNNLHTLDPEVGLALLSAMHLQADHPQDAAACLHDLEGRAFLRGLPVAWVCLQDSPGIPLWRPQSRAHEPLAWTLEAESGALYQGLFRDLPPPLDCRKWEGQSLVCQRLALPSLPAGYHRLALECVGTCLLIVTPPRCFEGPASKQAGARRWGLGLQLYALKSNGNWGMGDFKDLRALIEQSAAWGADCLGLNPLHALFPNRPESASPYSPSSRRMFNWLYLDLEALDEFSQCPGARSRMNAPVFQAQLRALRASRWVDYPRVCHLKKQILELLFEAFLCNPGRRAALEIFRSQAGSTFEGFCRFQALQEHFSANAFGWQDWPAAYRNPQSPTVETFAKEHAQRVDFWAYVQWNTQLQVEGLGTYAQAKGMAMGLYGDLAVGVDGQGADAWLDQASYAFGASIGAPPDAFNPQGQDWGLPPLIPHRLEDAGFEPFIQSLRAQMRGLGALRVDHVMGLMRQFWVPKGVPASQGAYVSYPFQDLLGILCLESQRNQCRVVGEDLGTVPAVVRTQMEARGILSCHPLYFEKTPSGQAFKAPESYPPLSVASVGTHDLPTLRGYWEGHHLSLRESLGEGLGGNSQIEFQREEREADKAKLLHALGREGLLNRGETHAEMDPELVLAIHRFLARSASELLLIQPEDILGQLEQVNLPGSLESQYPNWRQKLSLPIEEWNQAGVFKALRQLLSEEGRLH